MGEIQSLMADWQANVLFLEMVEVWQYRFYVASNHAESGVALGIQLVYCGCLDNGLLIVTGGIFPHNKASFTDQ